ncbi:MAG TPA: hypothetical protein DEB39_13740 [Planctomycetaceae bacterium]|nr:hypothetical protein [Planctomycetaceae bacterium]
MNTAWKKRLVAILKWAIVILILGWVIHELHQSRAQLTHYPWRFRYGWLGLSGLIYLLAYIPACAFWYLVMRSLGQRPRLYDTVRAYYIGHLGKYVPGKAMVVILRAGLVSGDHVRPGIAAVAVFFETLTMMAVGAFLSAVIIIVWFRGHPQQSLFTLTAVGMMCVAALPLHPPLFRFLAKKCGVGRGDPEIDVKLRGLNLGTLAVGWGLMSITWILLGAGLWATIRGIGFDPGGLLEHLPRFTAAVAMSLVLGFLTMIPGGFMVREWGLVQLLKLYFAAMLAGNAVGATDPDAVAIDPEAVALVIAAMQRLISILAELAASAVLLPKRRRRNG